jgi:hypothetical protein
VPVYQFQHTRISSLLPLDSRIIIAISIPFVNPIF